MSNIKKHCIYTALYNVGFTFCSGAIMQTFLLQAGFAVKQVYLLNSFMQIMQVAMMVVMTFLSGKIKRVKKVMSVSYLSLCLMAAVFLCGVLFPRALGNGFVVAVFIAAGVSYVGVGLYTILAYCLPYYTIDMKEYGKMTGISTALSGGAAFAFSFIHTLFVSKLDYMQTTAWFFLLAIACFIATSLICNSMKEIEKQGGMVETTKEDVVAVFKNKDTFILLLPNFARGLAAGIMGVIAVIAISKGVLNEQTSSLVNIVMQIATFAGNFLYVFAYKKLSSATLLCISTVGVCIFFPVCIYGGMTVFLILFFVTYLFRIVIDTAIPVVVTEIIPQRQIGAYTSIRMLVFTGAQAVATLVISPLVTGIGYGGLLIFAAAMQLVCGVGYYAVAIGKKRNRQ